MLREKVKCEAKEFRPDLESFVEEWLEHGTWGLILSLFAV